jgi:thiamine pyrophosphate-dependent acetolactate synthase large subunit-like protein
MVAIASRRRSHAKGVTHLFTLIGGHISPIVVGAKRAGIRVVDVRHEVNAVFAADAYARLSGIPGVAAVTAGPGVTNTITALKNAQLAQSPVVLFGGATATALKGRGALQDIDQRALVEPHVKRFFQVERVRDLGAAVTDAFALAKRGTPGPVFIEAPVDVLYDEAMIREQYLGKMQKRSFPEKVLAAWLTRHVSTLFADKDAPLPRRDDVAVPAPDGEQVVRAALRLMAAERPLLVIGSQAVVEAAHADAVSHAVLALGIPVYLSGMARGLLGPHHPLHMRHKRREALREADVVVLAGVTCDFRLDYGAHIGRKTFLISANRRMADMMKNRVPDLRVQGDAGAFLVGLARETARDAVRPAWREKLAVRDAMRDREIDVDAAKEAPPVNPIALCQTIESVMADDAIIVVDGGDFVATASYVVHARRPVSWLDPGAFGTLGVGAGFAMGARALSPDREVWILYGDGSVGYSITEFDTFVRHRMPVIAVVGNDACWMQIARDQGELLGDLVGCELARTDYHRVVEGFGAKGLLLDDIANAREVLLEAKSWAKKGVPVLVNVHIGRTDFRKGSLSV